MKTVITFGTFDVFHVGHLRLLQRARTAAGRRIVRRLKYRQKGQSTGLPSG